MTPLLVTKAQNPPVSNLTPIRGRMLKISKKQSNGSFFGGSPMLMLMLTKGSGALLKLKKGG